MGEYKDMILKTSNVPVYWVSRITEAIVKILSEENNFEGKESGSKLLSLDEVLLKVKKFKAVRVQLTYSGYTILA